MPLLQSLPGRSRRWRGYKHAAPLELAFPTGRDEQNWAPAPARGKLPPPSYFCVAQALMLLHRRSPDLPLRRHPIVWHRVKLADKNVSGTAARKSALHENSSQFNLADPLSRFRPKKRRFFQIMDTPERFLTVYPRHCRTGTSVAFQTPQPVALREHDGIPSTNSPAPHRISVRQSGRVYLVGARVAPSARWSHSRSAKPEIRPRPNPGPAQDPAF